MREAWALFSLLALVSACEGELVPMEVGGPAPAQVDAGAPGQPDADRVLSEEEEHFESYIKPLLQAPRPKGSCALCHQGTDTSSGPNFMGVNADDNYQALLSDAEMIASTPEESGLLLRGDHAGNAFCSGFGVPYNQCQEDELDLLKAWIRLEGPATQP